MRLVREVEMTVLASPHTVELFQKSVVCAATTLFLCDRTGRVTRTLRKRGGNFYVRKNALIAQTASAFRVYALPSGKEKLELVPRGYSSLRSVSRDGARMLTSTYHPTRNKAFTVWDVRKKRELASFADDKSTVVAAALSDDGALVVHGGTDGVVRFFDVARGEHVARAPTKGWIEAIATYGDRFAIGGRAGVVSIVTRDARIERKLAHGGAITGLDVSARCVVARGTKSAPIVWDLETGEQVRVDHHDVAGLRGGARSARFSADGTRIVTCGNDCRVVVSKIEL